ncbi:hypothetical protein IW140_005809 [Coemansia sp. RSA 1813]|nr:hypothetical protein LPJ74_005142 [Coemansia sp. RSA 1843]KAJ2564283.1 hypothetical protein IW140_005809 [Coemansia sp. RSA 1813]
MVDCSDLVVTATAMDAPSSSSSNGGQQLSRGPPYKYDIHVTGDLYADDRDNGAATKVSVKIVGNEDGDVVVKQDDSFDSESQNPTANGETRNPQFTTKRSENGGLELHIRALPLKPRPLPPTTITGGGAGRTNGSSAESSSDSNSRAVSRAVVSRIADTPSRLRTIESYSRVADTRANTRMSEYARSRLSSAGQSFMEIRPAFEDASVMSDSECLRESRTRTHLTAALCASPVLVGGGGSFFESRPRSQSMTKMEDKSTMTTWRGIPEGLPTRNSSRTSVSTSATTVSPEEDAGTGKSSPALSVLRGGGGCYHEAENGVFSAFNGPPAAPPEHRTKGRDGTRGQSLPMDKYALPPRRSSKDKVNYRERVENLLTQYYPEHMLRKYLDELRRRYRFMGSSEMSSSEILKLLVDNTTDTQVKEQLRASVEELLKAQASEAASSDNEQTVSSSPSGRHYLSIRETELRDVLDRTSVSPVPKGVRTTVSDGLLVGGGMSMDQLSPVSQNYDTLYSDRMSVAASVVPAESVHSSNPGSTSSSPNVNPVDKTDLAPDNGDGNEKSTSDAAEDANKPSEGESEQSRDDASSQRPPSRPTSSGQQQQQQQQNGTGANANAGAKNRAENLDPRYWDDDEKYRVKPPNMRDAFTILKSQPIFVREMPSSDIAFKSPFSRRYESPVRDEPSDTPAKDDSQPTSTRPESSRKGTNSFSEKHPAESKVAKAVSELEEVLRRTEADALAGIENDFHEQSCTSRCCAGEHVADEAESVASHSSLVGGGASSRSASASTRISAMVSKMDSMRPDSASKLWASDSTIRTDVLLMAGKEFDDANQIDNDGNTEAGDDEEAAVPVERDAANESSVSLPMRLEDMSAELAAVLRRTGGVDDLRLKRTKSPVSTASYHSRQSTASHSGRDTRSQIPRLSSAKASEAGSSAYRSTARSSGTTPANPGAENNRSLTELDVVMGRTGGAINRSALSSRASAASPDGVLRGGSGTPGSPIVANDSENELASVMRRTTGYVPSVSSLASPAASDNGRPDTSASDLKSVRAAERPASIAASARVGIPSAAKGYSSPQPAPRSTTRTSAFSSRSPAGSIAASGRGDGGAAPPTYASSPLRGPAYQPSERSAPFPGRASQYNRPPQQQQQQQTQAGEPTSRYRSPSPELYRLPTPVFGRFPSPPAHIKNRARENHEQENGGTQEQPQQQPQQQQQQQQRPADSQQDQPGSARYRPHSHSVGQRATPEPADQYQEEPVVDRLDLETGSLASRRSRPRQGSEFGSSSTLTNGSTNLPYNIPKVVEEDIDSLASYPNLSRPRSPVLVGGGKVASVAGETRAQSTLRGGGVLLPAFTNKDSYVPSKKCESGCCGVCGKGVEKDDIVVRPQVMHASCLRCEACDCLLTSSTFRAVDGHVYCEKDYKRYFEAREENTAAPRPKVVAVRPGISDKKFEQMNRAIMESFTSVDDFLQHMQQLREKSDQKDAQMVKAFAGDQSQICRNGDVGVDRQTHYEREQATSPSGTPWITERVVDKKVKTKVLEKRYPASAIDPESSPASVKSRFTAPAAMQKTSDGNTLVGGGNGRSGSSIERPGSNASRPSTALLNDTKSLNGWDHPLCPGCGDVVYLNDRVVHEGYGYHRTCMRCRQCSQVVPSTAAIRIKGAIYCKKHGNELLRRRSILMRKKSTMGRRSRHHRRRSGVSRERFVPDGGSTVPAVPPVPSMPMYSGQGDSDRLPPPSVPHESGTPRRMNSAMRNFLDAAAEQIDNGSFARSTPVPASRLAPDGHSTPMPQRTGTATSNSNSSSETRRPLPVPKPKTAGQPKYKAQPQPSQQQQKQQQTPFYNRAASPPRSPPPSSGPRSGSRSIFAGSRESHYDSNVVNALRQEAQRQINGSQASISGSPQHSRASSQDLSGRYLSPCGPSIAEVLNFGAIGRQDNANTSSSSQFDPFADSQDQINGSSDFASPRDRAGAAFSPNVHLDNLERRFRNANFRPPWALKSQTMFE